MNATRRDFLDRLAVGAVALGGLPPALGLAARSLGALPTATSAMSATPAANRPSEWDVSWTARLDGKHRVVFDVPEVESGYGVWRASIWARQYQDVLGVPAGALSAAVVLRHNGIVLAMQQAFWDEYGIGKAKNVTHPITLEPTGRNPALLSESDGVPEPFAGFTLGRLLARGGVVLACNLALQDCIQLIKARHGLSDEAARKRALALMVPGVILQPSGVFAVVRAQEAGCHYVRAS
jgi:hypothetical protein